MWIADDFIDQLAGFDLDVFEASANTVYAVRDDLSLGYHNRAWMNFARENGGNPSEVEGEARPSLLAVTPPTLVAFYEGLFADVLEHRRPREHHYQCPSATLERWYQMVLRPLPAGVLVTNHLRVEQPHDATAHPPDQAVYTAENGIITQCAHCRTTRRANDPTTWDWVPSYVDVQPDNLSHGLCPTCFQYHYPESASRYYAQRRGD